MNPKDPNAVNLGRKGGEARAASLSSDQKSAIARKAAAQRWAGHVRKNKPHRKGENK